MIDIEKARVLLKQLIKDEQRHAQVVRDLIALIS